MLLVNIQPIHLYIYPYERTKRSLHTFFCVPNLCVRMDKKRKNGGNI